MAPVVETFIDTPEALAALCEKLTGHPILAVDTEFIREQSYVPSLELVQVATPDGTVAAVDYRAIGRMPDDPLVALLTDPSILKVLHAADQDLEMLQLLTGVVPGPIWDTQLVTGLFGYSGRLGYQAVVENMLGKKPTKGETLTDWSQRPLTPEQLHYALEDVRFLIPLYEAERRELQGLGREAWALEECERVRCHVERNLQTRADQQTLFYRIKGWSSLDRRGLAVLRELAIWREQEAARRNRPRGSVMRDEYLVEMARRAPNAPHQLRAIRGLHPRDLERHTDALLAVIKRGKAVPPEACPTPDVSGPQLDEAEAALASLLNAVLHVIAAEKLVSATLVGTVADLQRLVEAHRKGQLGSLPMLNGWRGELVGQTLIGILTGELSARWDPRAKHLCLEPVAKA
ncbi:MAG: ribonuclease D [Candidatus Sericytochromatia bacterium]|nr:ribonuclease D [Candidatus Sericytochromatia bacterium]